MAGGWSARYCSSSLGCIVELKRSDGADTTGLRRRMERARGIAKEDREAALDGSLGESAVRGRRKGIKSVRRGVWQRLAACTSDGIERIECHTQRFLTARGWHSSRRALPVKKGLRARGRGRPGGNEVDLPNQANLRVRFLVMALTRLRRV